MRDGVKKKYWGWSCIDQLKLAINNALIFFKMVYLAFNTRTPASFLSVEVSLKHPFWYGMLLNSRISFNIL